MNRNTKNKTKREREGSQWVFFLVWENKVIQSLNVKTSNIIFVKIQARSEAFSTLPRTLKDLALITLLNPPLVIELTWVMARRVEGVRSGDWTALLFWHVMCRTPRLTGKGPVNMTLSCQYWIPIDLAQLYPKLSYFKDVIVHHGVSGHRTSRCKIDLTAHYRKFSLSAESFPRQQPIQSS